MTTSKMKRLVREALEEEVYVLLESLEGKGSARQYRVIINKTLAAYDAGYAQGTREMQSALLGPAPFTRETHEVDQPLTLRSLVQLLEDAEVALQKGTPDTHLQSLGRLIIRISDVGR